MVMVICVVNLHLGHAMFQLNNPWLAIGYIGAHNVGCSAIHLREDDVIMVGPSTNNVKSGIWGPP